MWPVKKKWLIFKSVLDLISLFELVFNLVVIFYHKQYQMSIKQSSDFELLGSRPILQEKSSKNIT